MSSTDGVLRLLLLAVACASSAACASGAEVCPALPADPVQQIHLFDGPPTDLAYLAPDGTGSRSDVYTLSGIHARGGSVTVRCIHRGGAAAEVLLKPTVARCHFRRDADGASHLRCR
jgi:hypothetical protein